MDLYCLFNLFSLSLSVSLVAVVMAGEETELLVGMKNDGNKTVIGLFSTEIIMLFCDLSLAHSLFSSYECVSFIALLLCTFLTRGKLFLFEWNVGELPITIIAIRASVHLPFDHKLLVQNLSAQVIVGLCMVSFANQMSWSPFQVLIWFL